jgi:putative N6-adenine-specific DNA methylase
MAQFFAVTSKGLEIALAKELNAYGAKRVSVSGTGVAFEGSWEDVYRLNLRLRTASRIIKPVLDFPAYQLDELYNNIYNHNFVQYFSVDKTFKIDASVKESMISDQRMVAMKVKDAIADQFREEFGERPSVENGSPDVRILVKAYKNRFSVAIDTTGESLFQRGYRVDAGPAPLKETVAAGLLLLADWDMKTPIYDPMCGSGTILIEAALMAMNFSPGLLRKEFGLMKLNNFDPELWDSAVQAEIEREDDSALLPGGEQEAHSEGGQLEKRKAKEVKEDVAKNWMFCGSDIDKKVLGFAKINAKRAGVDHLINFKSDSVATIVPPFEKGIIFVNPPYGARLGDEDNLRDVYRDFGFSLRKKFSGWTAWILSGNKDLIPLLSLKAERRIPVYNGQLECRLLKYVIK